MNLTLRHPNLIASLIATRRCIGIRTECPPCSGGDLAPSLGGTKLFFADQDFSHWPGFRIFPFCSQIFRIFYYVQCRTSPFPHKNNHYFRKEFIYDTFLLLCSYFRAHPTTLLKILGGRMHGSSSTSNLGAFPQSPKFPPLPPCHNYLDSSSYFRLFIRMTKRISIAYMVNELVCDSSYI